jgi:peptidoglycan hydrolase CwlO-like protein
MQFSANTIGIFFGAILIAAVFSVPAGLAQSTAEQVSNERAALNRQLAELEKQIADFQSQLSKIKGQKNTLAGKIAQLKANQQILEAQIKASALRLGDLEILLRETAAKITADETKIKTLRAEMEKIIFDLHREESRPFVYELILSDNLSQALFERTDVLRLTDELSDMATRSVITRQELEDSAKTIESRLAEQEKNLALQALQRGQLLNSVSEQKNLLSVTQGKESKYQSELADTKKEVAAIKNRLYQLLEVDKQISFGQAVSIAQWAGGQTGVRAAFLLAILTQESNLGKNVGTCNRKGDPASKSWKVVMKPERDHEPFKKITSELGLNIDTTPVSCPMRDKNGNQMGWGGAMGPAQFIPSTWMGYRAKVTAITGKAANPWDIRDAFLAAAIKLKADGAGSESGEWAAAMRYFSGGTNKAYSFYSDNVVAIAADYAEDIKKLSQ